MLGIVPAQKIAIALGTAEKSFSTKIFLKGLEKELEELELKNRMLLLSRRLGEQLEASPKSFPTLVKALKKSDEDKVGLSGFLVWPLTHFVAEHGLHDFDSSLKALKEMTKVFTAEFAVRSFFLKDEKYMLKVFKEWSRDENEHVRRLVSEGSRPLLPWGQKLPRFLETPSLTWPLLESLKNDSSRYVQKSVANHMNDISKKHGDWLIKQLKNWPNEWVARHAVRSLVKQGNPGALKIIGADTAMPEVKVIKLISSNLKVGSKLLNEVTLKNPTSKPMTVILDIEVHLLKANGSHSSKVFKGRRVRLEVNETQKIEVSTPLKKVTTRKYYDGLHYCNLMINGQRSSKKKFQLSV